MKDVVNEMFNERAKALFGYDVLLPASLAVPA